MPLNSAHYSTAIGLQPNPYPYPAPSNNFFRVLTLGGPLLYLAYKLPPKIKLPPLKKSARIVVFTRTNLETNRPTTTSAHGNDIVNFFMKLSSVKAEFH